MSQSGADKRKETIAKRQEEQKARVLEALHKHPIVTSALLKAGVSSSTYYRWREEDEQFKAQSDEAYLSGAMRINDMAESQLIKKIHEGDRVSVTYWLNHRHPGFSRHPVMLEDPRQLHQKNRHTAWYLAELLYQRIFGKTTN